MSMININDLKPGGSEYDTFVDAVRDMIDTAQNNDLSEALFLVFFGRLQRDGTTDENAPPHQVRSALTQNLDPAQIVERIIDLLTKRAPGNGFRGQIRILVTDPNEDEPEPLDSGFERMIQIGASMTQHALDEPRGHHMQEPSGDDEWGMEPEYDEPEPPPRRRGGRSRGPDINGLQMPQMRTHRGDYSPRNDLGADAEAGEVVAWTGSVLGAQERRTDRLLQVIEALLNNNAQIVQQVMGMGMQMWNGAIANGPPMHQQQPPPPQSHPLAQIAGTFASSAAQAIVDRVLGPSAQPPPGPGGPRGPLGSAPPFIPPNGSGYYRDPTENMAPGFDPNAYAHAQAAQAGHQELQYQQPPPRQPQPAPMASPIPPALTGPPNRLLPNS